MKKRIVSLLLCLIMALSLIPTTAFAMEAPDADSTPEVQAATNEIAVQKDSTDYSKVIDWKQFYGYTSYKYMNSTADDTKDKCTVYYGTTQWTGFVDKNSTIRTYGITIKPATGYYVKQVVIACDDQGGYHCETAHRDGIVKFGNSSTQSADFVIPADNLVSNKYIGGNPVWHPGAGYPNHLMIWLAKSPNPAEVIYDAGKMSDVLSGKTLIAYDSAEVQPTDVVMDTGYPQAVGNTITYQYNRETSKSQPQHTILDMLDTFKTVKGSDGKTYMFTGWRAYSSVDAAGSESWNEVTGSSAVGDKLTLYANYKLVAQWEAVEITTGSLIITKKVNAPMGTTTPDSFTFTVSGYSDPVTVTAADNWTKTITVNAGTYTVTENASTVPGGYELKTTYAPENGTVTVTAGGSAEVTVVNTYTKIDRSETVNTPAKITITKVDKDNNNTKLTGAVFQLRDKDGKVYGTFAEVGNGVYTISDIKVEEVTRLYLYETTAPAGYETPTDAVAEFEAKLELYTNHTEWKKTDKNPDGAWVTEGNTMIRKVETTGSTNYDFSYTIEITNDKAYGTDIVNPASLTVVKTDAKDGTKLEGAKFVLISEDKSEVTMTTGKDGKAVFTGLTKGTYTLKEVTAPEGYQASDKTWTITVSDDAETAGYELKDGKFVKVITCKVDDVKDVVANGSITITNEKVITDVTATFNVEKVVERQRGSRKPGKADFTFEAYYTDANGKLVKIDQTLTISTWGVGKYNASWDLVVPAAAFNDNGVASLTVKEVNGKKSGWTYDKTAYELIVTRDGKVSFPAKPLANAETDSAAVLTVTFTNSYYKHSFNGGDKPIESVKTGDMGIAMYAMTSLLSLGGAALVIKKRKDEE